MEFLAIFALPDSAGGAQGHDLGEEGKGACVRWRAANGHERTGESEQPATAPRTQQRPQSPFLGKSVGQKFARKGGRGK